MNRVIIKGNLGADPELKYTNNETPVCNLSVATNSTRKNANGEDEKQTEWHRIVTFGATAINCSKYLQKGRSVYVEGRLQTSKWKDKEGNDRFTTNIIASSVEFIGAPTKGESEEVALTPAPGAQETPVEDLAA